LSYLSSPLPNFVGFLLRVDLNPGKVKRTRLGALSGRPENTCPEDKGTGGVGLDDVLKPDLFYKGLLSEKPV
jgi:hypothetical protein